MNLTDNMKQARPSKARMLLAWACCVALTAACVGGGYSTSSPAPAVTEKEDEQEQASRPSSTSSYPSSSWTPESSRRAENGPGIKYTPPMSSHSDSDVDVTGTVLKGGVAVGTKLMKGSGGGIIADGTKAVSTAAGQAVEGDYDGAAKTWGKWFISTLGGVIVSVGTTAAIGASAPAWVAGGAAALTGYIGYKATEYGLKKLPGDPFGYNDTAKSSEVNRSMRGTARPVAAPPHRCAGHAN